MNRLAIQIFLSASGLGLIILDAVTHLRSWMLALKYPDTFDAPDSYVGFSVGFIMIVCGMIINLIKDKDNE